MSTRKQAEKVFYLSLSKLLDALFYFAKSKVAE